MGILRSSMRFVVARSLREHLELLLNEKEICFITALTAEYPCVNHFICPVH